MFFTWYRDRIAEQVENKMFYLNTCLNERNIILSIISPKTYKRSSVSLCDKCNQKKKCEEKWNKERKLEEENKLE